VSIRRYYKIENNVVEIINGDRCSKSLSKTVDIARAKRGPKGCFETQGTMILIGAKPLPKTPYPYGTEWVTPSRDAGENFFSEESLLEGSFEIFKKSGAHATAVYMLWF